MADIDDEAEEFLTHWTIASAAVDLLVASDAQDPQPYLDLGILLLDQAKADQALPPLQKAVSLDPRNPRGHEELSRTWEQLRDLPKADAEMHAALSLAPDIPALHFEMGRIFQQEGMSAKAKDEFARCEALNAAHSTDSAETPNPTPPNEPKNECHGVMGVSTNFTHRRGIFLRFTPVHACRYRKLEMSVCV